MSWLYKAYHKWVKFTRGIPPAGSAGTCKKTNLMANSGLNQDQQPISLDGEGLPFYPRQYRWVMLALIWTSYCIFGLVSFSLPALVTPVIEDLNITYSQMGVILGAWPLTYIVVAVMGGPIVDRLGIRKSIFIGITLMAISSVLRYFAGGFGTMFLSVALFGVGGPMISVGAPKVISLWFHGKERGMAVGIYMTGLWVGGAIILSTMNSVVMPLIGYSWRIAFVYLSLLTFFMAVLWGFLAREVKPAEDTASDGINKVFRSLISLRNIRLVLVMGFLSFAVGHGVADWLPKILEVSGLSPATAGLAAALPIWIGIPVIIVAPRLVPPHLRGRFISVFSLVVMVSIMIIVTASGVPLMIGLVAYGLFNSSILSLMVLILMDLPEVGSKHLGSAAGMFFCVAELGGVAGPFFVGVIKDWAGGFVAGAVLLAGLSLIRVVLPLYIKVKPAGDTGALS